MNNNTSNHESVVKIKGLCTPETLEDPTTFAEVDYSKSQTTVKYVVVEEDNIYFYIPIGATFYTE